MTDKNLIKKLRLVNKEISPSIEFERNLRASLLSSDQFKQNNNFGLNINLKMMVVVAFAFILLGTSVFYINFSKNSSVEDKQAENQNNTDSTSYPLSYEINVDTDPLAPNIDAPANITITGLDKYYRPNEGESFGFSWNAQNTSECDIWMIRYYTRVDEPVTNADYLSEKIYISSSSSGSYTVNTKKRDGGFDIYLSCKGLDGRMVNRSSTVSVNPIEPDPDALVTVNGLQIQLLGNSNFGSSYRYFTGYGYKLGDVVAFQAINSNKCELTELSYLSFADSKTNIDSFPMTKDKLTYSFTINKVGTYSLKMFCQNRIQENIRLEATFQVSD